MESSHSFELSWTVRQVCLLLPLLYTLALEPFLRQLGDRVCSLALRRIVVSPGGAQARVSVYADEVSIFMLSHNDIKVVQKVLEQYDKVTGTKFNHNKSSGL